MNTIERDDLVIIRHLDRLKHVLRNNSYDRGRETIEQLPDLRSSHKMTCYRLLSVGGPRRGRVQWSSKGMSNGDLEESEKGQMRTKVD